MTSTAYACDQSREGQITFQENYHYRELGGNAQWMSVILSSAYKSSRKRMK